MYFHSMAKLLFKLLPVSISTYFFMLQSSAQNKRTLCCTAKIVVVSLQLENYKAALKEGIATAVRSEPGVLRMYAVYDKENPTHITVLKRMQAKKPISSTFKLLILRNIKLAL